LKETSAHKLEEAWSDELLGLLLDEAERALLCVEARADDVGKRVLTGDVPDRDQEPPAGVSELRLAIAELADAFLGLHADLEMIGERMRNVGIKAGALELESHPHVLDLVRLSLEILFRMYPTVDLYEVDQRLLFGSSMEDAQTPAEIYEAYAQLRRVLKARLS
jgi:hypothetical protein